LPKDKYTPIRLIGTGGMAEVWKASAQGAAGFKKSVAMKKVLPAFATDPEFARRFISEAQVASGLVHPNIVQVFDFGELEPGVYFIAMEYVGGTDAGSLSNRMQKDGRLLPAEVVLHIAIETVKGLGYAHSRSPAIIHRDVSPANLLVSFEGEVKLADFGIARIIGRSSLASTTVEGNVGYLSPEQARGRSVDARADLFALGATIYRLLTGKPLFAGELFAEKLASAMTFTGVTLDALAPLPAPIRAILMRALQARPEDRYATAEEMESDLSVCLDQKSTILTRRALASLTRQYFAEEFKRDTDEADDSSVTRNSVAMEMIGVDSAGLTPALRPRSSVRRILPAAGITLGVAGLLGAGVLLHKSESPDATTAPLTGSTPTRAESSRSPSPSASESPSPSSSPSLSSSATPSPTPKPTSSPTPTPKPKPTRTAALAVAPSPAPTAVPTAAPTDAPSAKPTIVRKIPNHDIAFLAGCTAEDLELIDTSILGAIRRGVPLFNKGDVAGCAKVYEDTSISLRGALPEACAGPRADLKAGLERAATMKTPVEKAWAIRDSFDGLVRVVAKQNQSP
jgi:serine/threonine protein kinase